MSKPSNPAVPKVSPTDMAPTTPFTTPPTATPPATGIGVIGFVTGQGAGPKPTGKGRRP